MKKLLLYFLPIILISCGAHQQKEIESADPMEYANSITPGELKEHLFTFASDDFEGRETGEPGQKKAAAYLKQQYQEMNIASPLGGDDYFQEVDPSYFRGDIRSTENVVAFIEGSDKPEQVVVISSHYDHIGINDDGQINNGADDDGSGTVGILEIAQAFKKAVEDGYRPKRSILFLHNTGEEKGLIGSKYYTDHPVYPLENTVADLNIDMIGRVDSTHAGNNNYIYLIGSDKLSMELHALSEDVNSEYTKLDLDYRYNDENDPNRFYYRSDHYNFAKHNVPVIFYFNGVHEDYHRPTDTPDKIDYEALAKRAKLVFLTAWQIANRDARLVVDKAAE
ncbi:MAG: M28 family metallopeptidase [Salegentibacter sp.]